MDRTLEHMVKVFMLRSAAEEMYEALKQALTHMEYSSEVIDGEWGRCRNIDKIELDGDLDPEIKVVRAAIAKAEGR